MEEATDLRWHVLWGQASQEGPQTADEDQQEEGNEDRDSMV